jgi:hypothetical protein
MAWEKSSWSRPECLQPPYLHLLSSPLSCSWWRWLSIRFSPSLYSSLGIFLPLIAVNCAILEDHCLCNSVSSLMSGWPLPYGFGSGIGWLLANRGTGSHQGKTGIFNMCQIPLKGLGITFIYTRDDGHRIHEFFRNSTFNRQ